MENKREVYDKICIIDINSYIITLKGLIDTLQNYYLDNSEKYLSILVEVEYNELFLIGERLETDDEYNKRIEEIERLKKSVKDIFNKNEYETYLKLKEKYENK